MIHSLIETINRLPLDEGGRPSLDWLSDAEQEVYGRLRVDKRRREWLLGRWTAKCLLRSRPAWRHTPMPAITVAADPDGAPFYRLEHRLPLSLSISHSQGTAFCALCETHVIGVDIERIEPRERAFVQDFLSATEIAQVEMCPPAWQDTLITVIWSLKESALKALRQGLRLDTRRVEVQIAALPASPEHGEWRPAGLSCAWPDPPAIQAAWQVQAWGLSPARYALTMAMCGEGGWRMADDAGGVQ